MRLAFAPLLIAFALVACGRGEEAKNESRSAKVAGRNPSQAGVTPMAQRVATLGVLNKRNGITRTIALKPGQSAQWRDLIVSLRACEATAPWEEEKLTGAFVRVFVRGTDRNWRSAFSGWLYKESPSLNVVESPVYDVWPKSCEMTYPAGPAAPAAPVTSSNRSSAVKSGSPAGTRDKASSSTPVAAPETAPPPPSAAESNAT